jgi:pantoate--beta-alanine ligase
MLIFDTNKEIIKFLEQQKTSGKKIGFVPTMGALHQGHLSLIETAKSGNDIVVVSIFVNPTQFNNKEDLKNYPRTLETDQALLKSVNTDILYIPSIEEIYPENEINIIAYDFGSLETIMEGKHRPGHFKGVAQVVSKLFNIIHPDTAYFGEKDFQQLAIIRELTKQLGLAVKIIGCPTLRESNGLAMSSRNMLLSLSERNEATAISKALFFIRDNWKHYTLKEICEKAILLIEHSGMIRVEYIEMADEETLQPLTDWNPLRRTRCCIAVQLGKVRLIDNVLLNT